VTITRVGTNQKFADGWSAVFGKGKKSATAIASKPAAKKKVPVKKKSAKKK
jgi:hypothetical protein